MRRQRAFFRSLVPQLVCLSCALATSACDKKIQTVDGSISVTADEKGFSPSSVKVRKGAAATMVFTRTTDETCATEVVFPQLDLKKDLPKNKPVAITIPTDKEQTLTFQCGMGMYKSSVVVALD